MDDYKFDVIVIGSGMSSLTCASILTRLFQKKVLVLEQNSHLGGLLGSFDRSGGYSWEIGLHHVGEMKLGAFPRTVFEFVTGGSIEWNKMPDRFSRILYPDFTYNIYSSAEEQRNYLASLFPDEKRSIVAYFRDIRIVAEWYRRYNGALRHQNDRAFDLLTDGVKSLAMQTTHDYLAERFRNPMLRSLLASQWGDYGLPPMLSAFLVHAVVVNHYIEGAYFPLGGSRGIVEALRTSIEKNGGILLTDHLVTKILLKGGRAVGVAVSGKSSVDAGCEFEAEAVVSSIGVYETFRELLAERPSGEMAMRLDDLSENGTAHVNLYVKLRESPETIGLNGENLWLFTSYDHDRMFGNRNGLMEGIPQFCNINFPSIKKRDRLSHTAEIISFVESDVFLKDPASRSRSDRDNCSAIKDRITHALFALSGDYIPNLNDLVDSYELSTPATTVRYTRKHKGHLYGIPATPQRFRDPMLCPLTDIGNLFLTGADTMLPGIVGAMLSGVNTVGAMSGGNDFLVKLLRSQ